MSLVNEYIESFGGYDAAKEKNTTWMINHGENWRNIKDATLLEYRREHNIFEVGDKVVWIKSVATKDPRIFEIGCNLGEKPDTWFLRHATDEEIKAGHRL